MGKGEGILSNLKRSSSKIAATLTRKSSAQSASSMSSQQERDGQMAKEAKERDPDHDDDLGPEIAKLEQNLSDLRVNKELKDGVGRTAATVGDDDDMPARPPSTAMGDDSILRGMSGIDFSGFASFMAGGSSMVADRERETPPTSGGGGGSGAPSVADAQAQLRSNTGSDIFKSSGGDSQFNVDVGDSQDNEDLGPGLPPMFHSTSSVNVYMPTKLRKQGSHTTGTYAEPANSARQELDTKHRLRDKPEEGGESGGAPTSTTPTSRPASGQFSSTKSGDELINMDNFNSASSATPRMQIQSFESSGGAGTLANALLNRGASSTSGPVFRANASGSLESECIEAIMQLGSSGGGVQDPVYRLPSKDHMLASGSGGGSVLTGQESGPPQEQGPRLQSGDSLSISVAHDVESPVFATGTVPPPTGLPYPQRLPSSREPSQIPGYGSDYSGGSIAWFPEGPSLLGGQSNMSGVQSYLNAFQEEAGRGGGALPSTPQQQLLQQQQQQQYRSGPTVSMPSQSQVQGGHMYDMPPRQGLSGVLQSYASAQHAPPSHHHQQQHQQGGYHHPRSSPSTGRSSRDDDEEYVPHTLKKEGGSSRPQQKMGNHMVSDKKGRYKCRYCGEIKSQHVCPALIDIPRASTSTQVDLGLTCGQHGAPYIPRELHGSRFLPVRVSNALHPLIATDANGLPIHPSMIPVVSTSHPPPQGPPHYGVPLSMQIPVLSTGVASSTSASSGSIISQGSGVSLPPEHHSHEPPPPAPHPQQQQPPYQPHTQGPPPPGYTEFTPI